jgi:hypothetical protein
MFVGHYGPSFALKAVDRSIPLWLLFVAVQFVDVLWGIFVLLGVEKVRIVPGITASSPLDLYYMPYTHSLIAAAVWACAVGIGYRFVRRSGELAAVLVGAAVFSHWILDLVVHRPDLPLYDNAAKVGFGIWNYPTLAFSLEAALLFFGIILYLRNAPPLAGPRYRTILFALVMLLIQGWVFFGPPPASDKAIAITALLSYALFGGVAYWLERGDGSDKN